MKAASCYPAADYIFFLYENSFARFVERILMKRRDTFEDAEIIRVCQEGIDYQGIVKHINEGIVIIREGIIIFANDAFYEISRKKPEQVIKSNFSNFIAAQDQNKVAEYCTNRFFIEDLPDRIEFHMPREGGDAIIEMKSRVVECGGAPGLLGALTDITERRQTRIELQRFKERLESILHAMNEAIVSMSPDGYKIRAINPAAEALYGIPLRDFTSGERHIIDFVHPDDLETVRKFYDYLPEVEFDQAQYRIISSNMKVKWVLDEGHVVYARGGATRRIDHVIKDITEEKHAIDALRQSEAKYKDFFNSTSDMAFAISPEGIFIDINDAGLKLLGFESKEEALANNVRDFYVDIAERTELIKEIYGKGHVVGRHVKFKNKKGEPLEVAITARAKTDDSGHILYHEGIVHNISKALENQRNRVLRNAAGGMCHYLNTHLMQLYGAQKFMKEDMITLDQLIKEFVQGEKPQETTPEIKKVMESMHDSLLSVNKAYERIAEVTRAFSQAFIYKEESYSTETILDIFKSYGYKVDE
jgi:PAS domain S-box-containing protein